MSSLAAFAFAALALGVTGAARGTADMPFLDVQPKAVRQGDCAFVIVRLEYVLPAAGECRWQGKTYSLFPVEGGYRCILPMSPSAPTGNQAITVVLKDPEGMVRNTELSLRIVKRDFGVQKLRMRQQTSKLYDDPSVEQEGKAIIAALKQESAEQLWNGPFVWPVKGRVSTGFGLARTVNGRIQYRHKGLDIAAPEGTPVLAPADGVVKLVREDYKLHGKTIVLDHGQAVGSLYIHLSSIAVKEGQRVSQGQPFARVGATGAVTGPHLHWGTYVAGEAVDPHLWINLPEIGQ